MTEPTVASTDIKDLSSNLRMRVDREVRSMSNESIIDVENLLVETIANLRSCRNARLPLLQLPIEILQKILENVASPLSDISDDFTPFWRSDAMAISMLSPVSRTCRQLRKTVTSHVSLWKTVSSSSQYRLPTHPPCGSDVPFIAIINGRDRDTLWGDSEAMDVSRIQELHVLNFRSFRDRNDAAELRRRFSGVTLSCLESLSVSSVTNTGSEGPPISLDEAPRLKFMALQSVSFLPRCTFPHLTHLALGDVHLRHCHILTADVLSHCPNLESLAISYPHMSQPISVPESLSQPLALHRLRRIILQLPPFLGILAQFYFSLFPTSFYPQNIPIAIQILNYHFDDSSLPDRLGSLLAQVTKGAASHLSFSITTVPNRPPPDQAFFTISAAGPQGTFHVTSTSFYVDLSERVNWYRHHGSFVNSVLDGGAHLAAVREVWITGRHPETERHAHIVAAFQTTIAALPALETIVLVVPTESGDQPAGPNLGLCPNALDLGHTPPSTLRTLRIVYGNEANRGPPVDRLNLDLLLTQLETGAYGHFDTLLLDVQRRLSVSQADWQRLKGLFATATLRHISRMPAMPLPDYCVEPYAGPGGSRSWLGSLW